MNLIINRPLDGAQKQVIYELTLKKRQSKKSTMSEKQLAARQQLARELMHERKVQPAALLVGSLDCERAATQIVRHSSQPPVITSRKTSTPIYSSSISSSTGPTLSSSSTSTSISYLVNNNNNKSIANNNNCTSSHSLASELSSDQHSLLLDELPSTSSLGSGSCGGHFVGITNSEAGHSSGHSSTITHISSTGSSCTASSFTRSDSSYSGSSHDSTCHCVTNHSQHQAHHQAITINELSRQAAEAAAAAVAAAAVAESDELAARKKKEASIQLNRARLEQLNGELEQRLHQYEYLVAQEKALLGAYNMMLFTNKGVNNFDAKDRILSSSLL